MSQRSDSIKWGIATWDTEEKQQIYDYLQHVLALEQDISASKDEIIEARCSHGGIICPSCKSEKIVKNGKHNEQQRFLCKDCKKSFGERTNSAIHATKKPLKEWQKFVWCMIDGLSLRKSMKKVEISLPTAFHWRHKILFALARFMKNDHVEGVVEADETYFLESLKGNHNKTKNYVMPRPSRRHGGKAKKRGISGEQVCVVCSLDRLGNILTDLTCMGRPSQNDLERFFTNRIKQKSILCTDAHQSYVPVAKKLDLSVKQFKQGKHADGIYHIQHVNSYHSRLKYWIEGFRGVSTKYLSNYLCWFKWLSIKSTQKDVEKAKFIFLRLSAEETNVTWRMFSNLAAVFI